jgi:hypothetical protein
VNTPVEEKFCIQKSNVKELCISLDNHIYDTDFMREIGGFPTECPLAVDRALHERVETDGKQWVIDVTVESSHIRDSLWQTLKHDYRLFSGIQREDQLVTIGDFKSFLLSPASALRITKHTREPMLFPYVIFHNIVRATVMTRRHNDVKEAKNRLLIN